LADCGYADLSDLVGIPFVDRGGRGGRGLLGIFRLAMERFGIEVPEVNVSAYSSREIREEMLRQIPRLWGGRGSGAGGSVVMSTMRICRIRNSTSGSMSGRGFIHSPEKTGSIIVRVDHPLWKNKIAGYYRWIR